MRHICFVVGASGAASARAAGIKPMTVINMSIAEITRFKGKTFLSYRKNCGSAPDYGIARHK